MNCSSPFLTRFYDIFDANNIFATTLKFGNPHAASRASNIIKDYSNISSSNVASIFSYPGRETCWMRRARNSGRFSVFAKKDWGEGGVRPMVFSLEAEALSVFSIKDLVSTWGLSGVSNILPSGPMRNDVGARSFTP